MGSTQTWREHVSQHLIHFVRSSIVSLSLSTVFYSRVDISGIDSFVCMKKTQSWGLYGSSQPAVHSFQRCEQSILCFKRDFHHARIQSHTFFLFELDAIKPTKLL